MALAFELCEDYLLVLFCLHSTFVEVGGFLHKGVRLGFVLCSDWSGWLNSVEVHSKIWQHEVKIKSQFWAFDMWSQLRPCDGQVE